MGFWNLFANSWNRGTRKPIIRNTAKSKRRSLGLESLEDRTNPTSFLSFVDPNPSAGNGFGTTILSLGSGKVAVTAPLDDAGGTDAGAVYLYNGSTGALISTISGSHANDQLGSGGLFAVGTSSTGNFLIASPLWDNGSVANAGALTFVSGSPASSITVDSTNSLVGSTANDAVGTGANVKVLTNNNYVVATPLWNGTASDVGAVTWGSGSTGVVGAISSTNSYVGATASDQIGSGGVIALSNGNYAFASPNFDTSVVNAGAATWGSGSAGSIGTVATSNSWVGAQASDRVGSGGLTALTVNGNFVISSPEWDRYVNVSTNYTNAGAATLIDGSVAISGVISSTNSFTGASSNDQIASDGIFALTNGNFVICSSFAETTDVGAVTWSGGTIATRVVGTVSNINSLEGSNAFASIDRVGSGGVTILNNGSYVVKSPLWSNGLGAATYGSGTAAITGVVSSSNSLVGSTAGDAVGTSVVPLAGATGNYVVVTPNWDNSATEAANVGAVTWGSRTAGVSGTISASNSIVGSTASDQVGSGGVTALSNGNYVVSSPLWNNGVTADVGAVTWATGSALTGTTVATSNSWVGSTASDQVGSGGVTALTGSGNFVIASPLWDNSTTSNVGATTRLTGSATSNGTISTSNSLYGDSASDQVGSGGVTALANGNYLVSSPLWNNGATTDVGAVTSLRGTVASAGSVSANYSVTGSTSGVTSITPVVDTVNSNFYFRLNVNVSGQAGGTILAGTINPTPAAFTSAASTTITYGDVLSFLVIASGNPNVGSTVPGAMVFSATGVPAGVSFNTATGALTGTSGSTAAGTYTIEITATNKVGSPATQSFNLIISQKTITVNGVTASNKTYNANTTASFVTTGYTFTGVVGSDEVTLDSSGASATFATPNVGNAIAVTYSGFTLGGAAAANYILTQPSSTTANITQAALTITGLTANNKIYDATTTATVSGTPTLTGVIGGTSVTLSGTPAYNFASANVGTAIAISTTGFTINNSNYSLTQPSFTANITPAALLITPVNTVRPFGATNPTLTATYTGLVGGETSSVVSGLTLSTTAVFSSLVGNYPISASGASAANYSISYGNGYVTVAGAVALTDPNPSSDNGFGTVTQYLTNGNVVVTAPYDDAGGANAGAVYLFNSTTGALISTLTGSNANDRVGLTGVTSLTNGNLVVLSAQWNGGRGAVTFINASTGLNGTVSNTNSLVGSATTDNLGLYAIFPMKNGSYVVRNPLANGGKGSVTWGSGTTGVSGTVTSDNSLVGGSTTDAVGSLAITELTNGNFVVRSPEWDGAKGAVTWGSKTAGVTGAVSASNSLVGSSANDEVGLGTVTALANGNFVVVSQNWDNGLATNAGAVTWLNGLNGKTREGSYGAVSSTNSIVGSGTGDKVGYGGVTALTGNNNFVVVSPNWGGTRGAATWASGTGDTFGAVSSTNSIVGRSGNADNVGSGTTPVTALGNGNYVVSSPNWETNTGAITWGNGTSGSVGEVTVSTSLVGMFTGSYVGTGITVLSNNNFVVQSSSWNDGTNASVGAATFASGEVGLTGNITSFNSLVGSAANDRVGAKVTILKNNNYVVTSSDWSGTKGAVTWGSGTTGVSGPVSSTNSLVGSTSGDTLGSGGITVLSDNDYIVSSPLWDNGGATNAGAVTFGFAGVSTSGVVGAGNSLVGSHTNDSVGSGGITVLGSGAYVVSSPLWNSDTTTKVGAVTRDSGSGILAATVSSSNSLVGSNTDDQVGSGGVTVLSNGNFVVASPLWDSGVSNAGAVTWVSGSGGLTGAVSSSNSLVGSNANDKIGSGGVTALKLNGNYVVASPLWNGNLGAATWGNGSDGSTKGTVSSSNSLVGSTSGDNVGSGGITALTGGNYLVRSANWTNNGYANAGALTWGDGTSGVQGAVAATNSLVGVSANTGLSTVSENVATGTYFVNFLTETGGARVSVGYQSPTSPAFTSANNTTFTVGAAGSFTFTASGNPASFFTLVSGSLPTGVTLNSLTGVLSGTPATGAQGTYNLTVRASNSWSGSTVDQAFTLTIN